MSPGSAQFLAERFDVVLASMERRADGRQIVVDVFEGSQRRVCALIAVDDQLVHVFGREQVSKTVDPEIVKLRRFGGEERRGRSRHEHLSSRPGGHDARRPG